MPDFIARWNEMLEWNDDHVKTGVTVLSTDQRFIIIPVRSGGNTLKCAEENQMSSVDD